MGILRDDVRQLENSKGIESKANAEEKKDEEPDDDDEETKKVDGVLPIGIGPDGVPLKRNNSDVMNNFFILQVCKSFTDIEKRANNKNQGEARRQARFDEEIKKRKEVWQAQTVGQFNEAAHRYEAFVRKDMGIAKVPTKVLKKSSEIGTESTGSGEMGSLQSKQTIANAKNNNKPHRSKTTKSAV